MTKTLQDALKEISSNIFSSTKGKLEVNQDPAVAAIAYSVASLGQGLRKDIYDSIDQLFPKTATEESFIAANAFNLTNNYIQRKTAEFATGKVLVTSESAVDVSVGSTFITNDGNVYESTVFRSTFSQSFVISSLERIDGIAYAEIPNHNLGNLMNITFAGAVETDFNGEYEITIIDKDNIKYTNPGANEVATGTITGSLFGAWVDVKSVLPNESTNKSFNDIIDISFTTDLTNSYITYNGITGGKDMESLDVFNARVIKYLQFPQNPGNIYQHISWVEQNTDANYCYFFNSEDSLYLYLTAVVSKMNDSYDFTNFTTPELAALKAKFQDNNQFSLSGVSGLQLSFSNFSAVNIGIQITGLSPSSNSMKMAIEKRLKAYIALLPINFYLNSSQLSNSKIESVILGARDEAGNIPSINGAVVSGASFSTNIQKPVLGAVSYA